MFTLNYGHNFDVPHKNIIFDTLRQAFTTWKSSLVFCADITFNHNGDALIIVSCAALNSHILPCVKRPNAAPHVSPHDKIHPTNPLELKCQVEKGNFFKDPCLTIYDESSRPEMVGNPQQG